ncbi:MAG TPA: preprotein translocase subunit SecE [Parvularculaceae bacterium]|nr:preprotein translocase subunit SecE [Parvularculaceae bacterium]
MPSGHEEFGSMAGEKKTGGDKGGQASTIEGSAEEVKKKKKTGALEFARQVRAEAEKVTWTSWKETRISTFMVLVMVVIMAIFFLLVDQTIRFGVCTILPIDCASQGR